MPPNNHEPFCRDRIRVIRDGFGWVDHRLVRDRYIDHCSAPALALYLFLVTVANPDGLSFWGDKAVCARLHLGQSELAEARDELVAADLLAYEKPLYQVLQLPKRARVKS